MRAFLKAAAGITAALIVLAAPAVAGDGGPVSKTVKVRDTGNGTADRLTLGLNKAAIIELLGDATDVLVSNPAIVDAIVRTPRRIYILGLAVGQTNAFFFGADGHQLLSLEISVSRDTNALGDILAKNFPGVDIKVESVNDNVVLRGTVPSAQVAEQARDMAVRYVGAADKVMSMLTVSGREQVMIRVRVAEMNRLISKQLGIDLKAMAIAGGVPISLVNNPQFSLVGRALSVTSGAGLGVLPPTLYDPTGLTPDIRSPGYNNVEGTIQAMERAGVMKLLSEPNLTAISGETANFAAGGQFPVPTGIDDNGNVRVEYKPYGVGLAFTPVVLSEGRISLKVSSEVSDITQEGALTTPSQVVRASDGTVIQNAGITIPGIRVRRAETTIELPSGGSMMMAGLLKDDFKQNIDGYPGLKDLPVLGALFRSRDYQNNQTELVIICTAVLVDPASGKELHAPTDGFVPATDAQAYLNGQSNATYRGTAVPAPQQPAQAAGGYIIE